MDEVRASSGDPFWLSLPAWFCLELRTSSSDTPPGGRVVPAARTNTHLYTFTQYPRNIHKNTRHLKIKESSDGAFERHFTVTMITVHTDFTDFLTDQISYFKGLIFMSLSFICYSRCVNYHLQVHFTKHSVATYLVVCVLSCMVIAVLSLSSIRT